MMITMRNPLTDEHHVVDEEKLSPPEDAPENWESGYEGWEQVAIGGPTGEDLESETIIDGEWQLPLSVCQERKWELVKMYRTANQSLADTPWGVAQSDEESRGLLNGLVTMATLAKMTGQPFLKTWTMMDNTDVDLDADAMIGFGMAVGNHIDASHARSKVLRKAIFEKNITREELEAIDVEEGWPE